MKSTRDRFLLLHSKPCFRYSEKIKNVNKAYYTNELVPCLKYTLKKSRTESTHHESIDIYLPLEVKSKFVKDVMH